MFLLHFSVNYNVLTFNFLSNCGKNLKKPLGQIGGQY
jgi:hypothetical protein